MRRDQITLLTLIASLAVGGTALIAFDKSGSPELVTAALGKELLLVPRATEEAPISLTSSDGTGLELTSVRAESVVVDPLSLADPTLFLREHVRQVAPEPPTTAADGVLDLRLGAGAGSVSVRFDDAIDLTRAARGRHGGATVTTAEIMVAVVRRDEMLRKAAERRLPVQLPVR